jgi:hypothetical protein
MLHTCGCPGISPVGTGNTTGPGLGMGARHKTCTHTYSNTQPETAGRARLKAATRPPAACKTPAQHQGLAMKHCGTDCSVLGDGEVLALGHAMSYDPTWLAHSTGQHRTGQHRTACEHWVRAAPPAAEPATAAHLFIQDVASFHAQVVLPVALDRDGKEQLAKEPLCLLPPHTLQRCLYAANRDIIVLSSRAAKTARGGGSGVIAAEFGSSECTL